MEQKEEFIEPQDEEEINYVLINAAMKGNATLFEEFLAKNRGKIDPKYNESIMGAALEGGNLSILQSWFEHTPNPLQTNTYGLNALQIAIKLSNGNLDIVRFIINAPLCPIKEMVNAHDVFGRTALDMDQSLDNPALLSLLKAIPGAPSESRRFINISQNRFLPILDAFSRNNNPQGEENKYLSMRGMCTGLGFLFLLYCKQGRKDEFFEILRTVVNQDAPLSKRLAEKYKNSTEVIEQFLNDIAWFKHDNLGPISGTRMRDRQKLFDIVKSNSNESIILPLGPALEDYTVPQLKKFTKNQLSEWLEFNKTIPNIMVEFLDNEKSHETALMLTAQNTWLFYDSNLPYELVEFATTEDFVEFYSKVRGSENFNFAYLSSYDKTIDLSPSNIPDFKPPEYHFSELFSPLHYAVMYNNIEETKKIYSENPAAIDKKDIYGFTPIERALSRKNYSAFSFLLECKLAEEPKYLTEKKFIETEWQGEIQEKPLLFKAADTRDIEALRILADYYSSFEDCTYESMNIMQYIEQSKMPITAQKELIAILTKEKPANSSFDSIKSRFKITVIQPDERANNIMAISCLLNDKMFDTNDGNPHKIIKELKDILATLNPANESEVAITIMKIKDIILAQDSNYDDNIAFVLKAFTNPGNKTFKQIRESLSENPAMREIMDTSKKNCLP